MAMVSPNDLQAAACKAYGFDEPTTRREWALCVNFWAANIASGLESSAVPLLAALFDCPLTRDELAAIALFQAAKK